MGVHMYVACFVCYKCNTERNRVNVFRTFVVKRNFLVTFRLEVILFTKAREIYKTFSLLCHTASTEDKHILQKGHRGKSHFKYQHL